MTQKGLNSQRFTYEDNDFFEQIPEMGVVPSERPTALCRRSYHRDAGRE